VTTDYFHQQRTEMANPASAMIAGALVGAVIGYLFFTEDGRRVRLRAELLVEAALSDLVRLRDTAHRAATAYGDSLQSLSEIANTSRVSLR
jgi:hypothetical protein